MTVAPHRELTLPVIDLLATAGNDDERAGLLERLRSAAQELGFFYVSGHGIPADVQEDLLAATRTFFALPEQAQREISNLNLPIACPRAPDRGQREASQDDAGLCRTALLRQAPRSTRWSESLAPAEPSPRLLLGLDRLSRPSQPSP